MLNRPLGRAASGTAAILGRSSAEIGITLPNTCPYEVTMLTKYGFVFPQHLGNAVVSQAIS